MILRKANPTDIYKFAYLKRTFDAPCWVIEVETWALQESWFWYRDPQRTNSTLLLCEVDFEIVALVGYEQIADHVWYIPGLYVEPDNRRSGYGRLAMQQALAYLAEMRPGDTAQWLVHDSNEAMLALSHSLGAADAETTAQPCNGTEVGLYRRFVFQLT